MRLFQNQPGFAGVGIISIFFFGVAAIPYNKLKVSYENNMASCF
jgi:hypothetical protein